MPDPAASGFWNDVVCVVPSNFTNMHTPPPTSPRAIPAELRDLLQRYSRRRNSLSLNFATANNSTNVPLSGSRFGRIARVGWFVGDETELDAELVFASIAKLSRREHLPRLQAQHFDYVVVDEVHHAAAELDPAHP